MSQNWLTSGEIITSRITKLLEKNLFPHEKEICSYRRKHFPKYDQSMNTPLEGENNGIKKYVLGPKSHHTVVSATKKIITLYFVDSLKFGKNNVNQFLGTELWSNTPTASHVTRWIEGFICG